MLRFELYDRNLRKLFGQSGWMYAATAFVVGLYFVETLLAARILSLHDFGLLAVIVSYPLLVQQVLDFRSDEVMAKYLAEFTARGDDVRAVSLVKSVWILDLCVSLAAYSIVMATAELVSKDLLHQPSVAPLMRLSALGLFFASLDSASGAVMRVFDRYRLYFLSSALVSCLRFGLVAWALLSGGGLSRLVQARVLAELSWALAMGVIGLSVLKNRLWSARRASIRSLGSDYGRELRRFIIHSNFSGSLELAVSKLDVLIVAFFWSPEVVGIYKMAIMLGGFLVLLSDPLYIAVLPYFSKLIVHGGIEPILRMGRRLTFLMCGLTLPLGFGMILFAGGLTTLVAGQGFAAAASPFVAILIGGQAKVLFFWLKPAILNLW